MSKSIIANQLLSALGSNYEIIEPSVYPSDQEVIAVKKDSEYDGAHEYVFVNNLGFSDGESKYQSPQPGNLHETTQTVRFVQKNTDGTMTPGLQSEQLVIALCNRIEKLNKKFPSPYNVKMMAGLNMFLEACRDRIDDRISRGVMGDLKK